MTDEETAAGGRQPTRSRRVREDRQFDRTQLRQRTHGNYVHRDYAAHFFRWGFASRFVKRGHRVLDAGCGQDLPLARVLNGNINAIPSELVAVDLNKLPDAPGFAWLTPLPEFDFTQRWAELGQFDVVVSFEVLEHMGEDDGYQYLIGLRGCMKPDGVCLLSTPNFDGKAAANHIHEWCDAELLGALMGSGFEVERRYGTFASWPAIKAGADREHVALASRLRDYYSDDVVACFLAPLYPALSRNSVWVLRAKK